MTRARDVMTREVVCVPSGMDAVRALEKMYELNVRHLPVLDGEALVGIVSDRDFRLVTNQSPPLLVRDIMTHGPITCSPTSTVAQLARLMVDKKIDSVPVVSRGRLVGLVTSTDLLQLLMDFPEPVSAVLPFDFRVTLFGGSSAKG